MTDSKQALVLNLAGGSQPLLIAIDPAAAGALAERLPSLLRTGGIESILAANGASIVVNFGQVQAAHVDGMRGIVGPIYGSLPPGQ